MAPTLLVPGSLQGHPATIPVDFLTQWLRMRMVEFGGDVPKQLSDRVIIAKSETGSGKSTVLPAHVFRLLRDPRTPLKQKHVGRSVLCTQPRVLTAMTLARDMSSSPHYPELTLPVGKLGPTGKAIIEDGGTVGFQTSPITHKPSRGLIYSTAGVLRAQLRSAAASGDF